MTLGWLPGFAPLIFDHSPGFPYRGYDVRAVCWHTTEGSTCEGAFSVFQRFPSCPHLTVQPSDGRRFQHVPTDKSAYALQHGNTGHVCGVETNASGVVQIEVVGRAAEAGDWPRETLRWLGEQVLAPILVAHPNIAPSVYKGPRMSETEWYGWRGGQCGHRDVCCQPDGHTDPGELDLDVILHYALESILPPLIEDDDMVILVAANPDGTADVNNGAFAYNGTHLRWVNDGNEYDMLLSDIKAKVVPVTDTKMWATIHSTAKVGGAPTSGKFAGSW